MQDLMPEPTYQGEPRLGVIPWEVTVRQQHSQRQTTSSSPKYQKPTFFRSWDPEQLKKMPCEKNLSDLGEKEGPVSCSLEDTKSWSLSGGNTDTNGSMEASASLHPTPDFPTPNKVCSHHMILCVSLVDEWVGRVC
ncbi:hypothetical protein HJG60_007934 [Phyllostomus discolor]|uniref:Uncharacterized protein n=1 Tax=Phyllostomus discolor TaxID=89673 RepID=A0A834EYC7_9CHIR|nr:hypothetical protein HJG60_007934 [Phyllostomus discolor]